MRRILPVILIAIPLLMPAGSAWADAAPPREPPGSNLLPAGETMVQMVAESVLIVIPPPSGDRSPANIEAVFAMRNQGAATESMDVRFPLEPIDGHGDGYEQRVYIEGFRASVDGRAVPVRQVVEPFTDGPSISWAVFPVTFEPGQDVRITVNYSTQLYGDEAARVDYILETGAGWFGPIESAVVVLRLPYAASTSNVFVSNPWDPQIVPTPAFVGREVRWHWRDLEPTAEDDLHLTFVWPGLWQEILDLEAATGENPADVGAAIALAEDYREAGSERHGFIVSDPLYHLSRTAIEEALAYNPGSLDLHVELAGIDAWRCDGYPPCSLEEIAAILERVDRLLEANPSEERLLEIQDMLQFVADQGAMYATQDAQWAAATQTAASPSAPLPTARPSPWTPAVPQATPTLVSVGEPRAPVERRSLDPLSGITGIAVGIAATLVFGAVLKRRPPPK